MKFNYWGSLWRWSWIAGGFVSLFLRGGALAADLSNLTVYPNPVRVYLGDSQIIFDNIVQADVVIYNSRATIVKEIPLEAGPFIPWNLVDDEGVAVPSGVYFFVVTSEGQTRAGKFAVIR